MKRNGGKNKKKEEEGGEIEIEQRDEKKEREIPEARKHSQERES